MKLKTLVSLITIITICCSPKPNILIDYFDNGDTLRVFSLNNGIKDGIYKMFYEGGSVRQIGTFQDGLKHGVFKTFFENGEISEYSVFQNDTLIYFKEFNENGKQINSIIGIKSPFEQKRNRIIDQGDTIQLYYTFTHSYYKQPLIGIEVAKLDYRNGHKTIEGFIKAADNIEYDLIEYDLGRNNYAITIIELNPEDTTVTGYVTDTLSFEIIP